MALQTTHRRPVLLALVASALLTALIILGSRNLEHYDSALFGYTVASVIAFGAVVFRSAIWLQRPATRVYWRRELYQARSQEMEQAKCARCGAEFMGQMWIDDLKKVVDQLGFDYSMGNGKTLQDYCPRCKRIMRGLAYAGLPRRDEEVFRGSRIEAGHPTGISNAAETHAAQGD